MARPRKEAPVWIPTSEMAQILACSNEHLHHLRIDGFFKRDIHYREVSRPKAKKHSYRWHRKNCENAFSVPPEMR